MRSCDRRTAEGRRDFAVLTVLLRLVLRVGEVAALELSDVDWRHGEILVRGKGRREERLPLPTDVGEAVAGWLRRGRSGQCSCTHVFTTGVAPRGALSGKAVSAIVRRAARRPRLKSVSALRLRHTAAGGHQGGVQIDDYLVAWATGPSEAYFRALHAGITHKNVKRRG
jgi:integrase